MCRPAALLVFFILDVACVFGRLHSAPSIPLDDRRSDESSRADDGLSHLSHQILKSKDNHQHQHLQERRILASDNKAFVPLQCNFPACGKGSFTWSSRGYNRARAGDQPVVIPCGQCITMDNANGDVLSLPNGLDIQGELIIPKGHNVSIETPFVRVQGVLTMSAPAGPVTDSPLVRIKLTGDNSNVTAFVPHGENEFVCTEKLNGVPASTTPTKCQVGAKPLVVAGGRLNIRGIREECKTWVQLHDIKTKSLKAMAPKTFEKLPDIANHPDSRCRNRRAALFYDFSVEAGIGRWSGNGASFRHNVTSSSLVVFDRTIPSEEGPAVSLDGIRNCLVANQDYLLSARIRLVHPKVRPGTVTSCRDNQETCLAIQKRSKFDTGLLGAKIGSEDAFDDLVYGEWKDFHFTMQFDDEELRPGAEFHIIRMVGPEEQVDIEIDFFYLTLPHPSTVPNPKDVCAGNLLFNGRASENFVFVDQPIHPYPFIPNRGKLSVESDDKGTNRYFRVDGRDDDKLGMTTYLAARGCVAADARYRFSARLQMQSAEPIASLAVLHTLLDSGDALSYILAFCPPSSNSWVHCQADFLIPTDFPSDRVQKMRLSIETIDGPTVPFLFDDIAFTIVHGPADGLIVPSTGIDNCWGKGAEVLITSHTTEMEGSQVRRLRSSPVPIGKGLVRLPLDSSIVPPISLRDGEFAVEVALISRNIVFEGDEDEKDSLLGGHLIVFHTPNVAQTISGIEFENFGRQGELGRYPIHFHMCESVEGSLVAKNLIRRSNQRGVVIHGSHNVTISENVAFEVLGHTFMTEDGGEMDNVFTRNLGASTRPVEKLVRPFETDAVSVSTFWISNPVNEFVGNVAAGSLGNGYWFELQKMVHPPTSLLSTSAGLVPQRLPMKLFRDNVAHSNRVHGLRTYPFGFYPPKQAIFHNTKSYKNRRDGIFFHNSQDLTIDGGVLADNQIQAQFDRADNIHIQDTEIIGLSESFRKVIYSQRVSVPREETVGIDVHSFVLNNKNPGSSINGVQFKGFDKAVVGNVTLLRVDSEDERLGRFSYTTSLKNISFENGARRIFDFQGALDKGLTGSYFIDLDGSMNPSRAPLGTAGSVVVNSVEMGAFLDFKKCDKNSGDQSFYCRGVCLRSVHFSTSTHDQAEELLLRLTSNSTGSTFEYPGYLHYNEADIDQVERSSMFRRRVFSAALPTGQYTAEFVDANTGALTWPGFVETSLDPTECSNVLQADDIIWNKPQQQPLACSADLVFNGKMESGVSPWLQDRGSISIVRNEGIDGSSTLSDLGIGSDTSSLGQFLDTRCMLKGAEFEVAASVRLSRAGEAASCEQGKTCPTLLLRLWVPTDQDGTEFEIQQIVLANSFTSSRTDSEWQLLHGTVVIDSRVKSASSVALVVERGQTAGAELMVDNVSMRRLTKSCENIVQNGDFSHGNASFWTMTGGRPAMESVGENNYALILKRRTSTSDTITQSVRTGCLVQGERYQVTAKVRLQKPDSAPFLCDPTKRNSPKSCPRLSLQSFIDHELPSRVGHSHFGGYVAMTDHGSTNDDWYTVSGTFHATEFDQRASLVVLAVTDVAEFRNVMIDDVAIKRLPKKCNELFANGDAELGDTAMFWRTYLPGGKAKIAVVPSDRSGAKALKVSINEREDGISQSIDHRCLTSGTSWSLSALMRLFQGETAVSCDPSSSRRDTACPSVRILGHKRGKKHFEERYPFLTPQIWDTSGANRFQVDFEVTPRLAACDRVLISIRSYNETWDMVVGNLSLAPIG